MAKYEVTVYCSHISETSVHCNRYLVVKADHTEEIDEKIEEQHWKVKEDEIICDDHK